jgi:acyl-CoA thioester hydrolase
LVATGTRFEQKFRVGWGDVDGNSHMANTAFLDRAADTRFLYYVLHGFPAARFREERVGPVIVRDELVYRKELLLMEEFTVDLEVTGLSTDGGRFQVRNTFHNGAGEPVATVTSDGLWLDLEKRRPVLPPADLDAVMRGMPHATIFHEIPPKSR